jgi:NDP-sugar pyrophosphorylase family protein
MTELTKLFEAEHAVLAQFDHSEDLNPVTRDRPIALLEVIGKPVIHHWLERLKTAGVKHITIVSSRFPEQIRQYVKRGERWGFETVKYVSTNSVEAWPTILNKLPTNTNEPCVYVSLNAFPQEPLVRLSNNEDYWVSWQRPQHTTQVAFPVRSLNSLWLINMQMLKKTAHKKLAPNTSVHPRARMQEHYVVSDKVVIGSQATVADSVICKDVDVGEATEIRQSLILNNTLLGSHLFLRQVIIDGSFVYDVKTKETLRINDPALFTRLKPSERKVAFYERLLASVLLIITGTLWLGSNTKKKDLRVIHDNSFDGQGTYEELTLTSLETPNPFANRVPWLSAVIIGRVPLFGVREQADSDSVLNEIPGVISAADFCDQNDIDIAISNAYQIHQQSITENLRLAGRWLPKVFMRRI